MMNTGESSIANDGIEGVYVVHALKGYETHAERLTRIFMEMGINFEFVTDGDPAFFNTGILSKYFTEDIKSKLSTGVLSCTLNHILCYEKIAANNQKYALVFENDPFFIGDFKTKIKAIAAEANTLTGGFIISLENTTLEFPKVKDIKKDKLLYAAKKGRCAGAYLINQQAARLILNDLKTNKCAQVIDWWHNTLIERNVIQMYWAHPPLTEQGSHNGLMSSTISSKNKNIRRRISWLLQKYYKTNIRRWFK